MIHQKMFVLKLILNIWKILLLSMHLVLQLFYIIIHTLRNSFSYSFFIYFPAGLISANIRCKYFAFLRVGYVISNKTVQHIEYYFFFFFSKSRFFYFYASFMQNRSCHHQDASQKLLYSTPLTVIHNTVTMIKKDNSTHH